MSHVLHITNGDGAANILKNSPLKGDVMPWRDPMHHGPFPALPDLDAVSQIRAQYLAGAEGDVTNALRDFRLRNAHLSSAAGYREIVLWFEHDLLDQAQILQLMDWFANAATRPAALTIICINSFDGIEPFRGLGQLNGDQMVSLFDSRQIVTQTQLQLAKAGWMAFRSANPKDLEFFMEGELAPLPFLSAALSRYLEEFPWTSDGLTRTERQIMSLISDGVSAPGKIFVGNMCLETAMYIGDWGTYSRIEDLCSGQYPMIRCKPHDTFRRPPSMSISQEEFLAQRLFLTALGEQVLSGQVDATSLIERDEWLGGVHLQSGHSMWMWDVCSKQLKLSEP